MVSAAFTVALQDELESRISELKPKNYREIRALFSNEIPYRLECVPTGKPTAPSEPEDQALLEDYVQAPENMQLQFRLTNNGLGFDVSLFQNIAQMPAGVTNEPSSLEKVAPYMDMTESGSKLGCTKGKDEYAHSCQILTAARQRVFATRTEGLASEGTLEQRFQIYPSTAEEMYVLMTLDITVAKVKMIRPDTKITQSQSFICQMLPAN